MVMTNDEIVADYRAAKNRIKQIGILAEQNLCSKQKICEVLEECGEKIPGNFRTKPKAKAVTPDKPKDEPKPKPKRSPICAEAVAFVGLRELLNAVEEIHDIEVEWWIIRRVGRAMLDLLDEEG